MQTRRLIGVVDRARGSSNRVTDHKVQPFNSVFVRWIAHRVHCAQQTNN